MSRQALTRKEIRQLTKIYFSDQLFCVMFPALEQLSRERATLHPVEAWRDAMEMEALLRESPRTDFTLKMIPEELEEMYEGLDAAWDDVQLTLFTMLFRMSAAGKAMENHPHRELCMELARMTYKWPLREELRKKIGDFEDSEERAGRIVAVTDYLLRDVEEEKRSEGCSEDERLDAQRQILDELVDISKRVKPEAIPDYEVALGRLNDIHHQTFSEQLNKLREVSDKRFVSGPTEQYIFKVNHNHGTLTGDIRQQRLSFGGDAKKLLGNGNE